MYRRNISAGINQVQKDTLKKQSYSNDNIFYHQKLSSLSMINQSTNSLPSLLEKKTSFAQFISDEKYNLQFFHSLKREIINNLNDEKKLIRNFHLLPYNVSDNYYSALADVEVIHGEKAETLSTVSISKRTQCIRNILAHKPIDINNINRKRHMRCVEPHVNCLNNEQTKAARCFILQLNTYINQKILSSQKQPDVQSKKLDVSSKELIELETNTTLKSYINDPYLARTNDTIDISMQLSDNFETTSNENDVLLTFYNQSIINNIFNRTANNIEANNSYDLIKSKSKTDDNAPNCNKIDNKMLMKNKRLTMNTSSKFHHETFVSASIENTEHVTEMATKSSQQMQTPINSLENIEMKDSSKNRAKIGIHQQLTMLNSSITNPNSHISKSSIDLRNLLIESNETKSSVPLHSRCAVAFEFADREQHLIEVIELPRSSHRMARLNIYKQIHKRLAIENLIDIDLIALLRTVLQ